MAMSFASLPRVLNRGWVDVADADEAESLSSVAAAMAASRSQADDADAETAASDSEPLPSDRRSFTVMQFNVLANSLSDAFPHAAKAALERVKREQLVVQEIAQFGPDVACLQELDFVETLSEQLGKRGYAEAVFIEKVSDNVDGCAIFYRSDAFELVADLSFPLACARSQVLALARLRHRGTGVELVVASAHLKAKPGFEQQRLRQVGEVLNKMADVARGADCVLCGDFNAEPSEPAYRAVADGRADGDDPQLRIVSKLGPMTDAYACGDAGRPGHPYPHKAYTTFKRRDRVVCRVSDYIFFTPRRAAELAVRRLAAVPYPPEKTFPNHMPCESYPSDHLAIVAELVMTGKAARFGKPVPDQEVGGGDGEGESS